MKVDISVIIPCTDNVKKLRECIKSVISQKNIGEVELLVIENNSEDRYIVPALLSEFDFNNIKHFYLNDCDNANVARNYGVTVSSGKYIAFLDSDDIWTNEHLSSNIHLMNSNDSIKAIYSGFILDNGKCKQDKVSRQILNETPYTFLFGKNSGIAQTSSFFIERTVFNLCSWDNSLRRSQDYDFFINIQNNFGWVHKEKLTTVVNWAYGEKRNLSSEAFEKFYSKHSDLMPMMKKHNIYVK